MIHYRPFLNTDSPFIVDIWRKQIPFRGLFSALTREILDQQVFSKPYFDRHGLILAFDEPVGNDFTGVGGIPRPLGFVHVGFGPNQQLSDVDRSSGVISQLKMMPGEKTAVVARGLLEQALKYLNQHGSKTVQVGGAFPHAPFYQGLYGGSRLPGVLVEDTQAVTALIEFGFETVDKILVLRRDLAGFRTLMGRDQMMLRRQYQIKGIADPLETTWWESCTFSLAERDRFSISHKTNREVCGSVSLWDMQPLASQLGMRCRGLYDLHIKPELRRGGMATFLVSEALKHMGEQGIGTVEVQVRDSDVASLGVFNKLGFQQTSHGLLMSKSLS